MSRSAKTGELLDRTSWIPVGPWGSDGNRYNRNMMSPAHLDGKQASIVITRGGNSRNEVPAPDFEELDVRVLMEVHVPGGGAIVGDAVAVDVSVSAELRRNLAGLTESTNYFDADGEVGASYHVRPVLDGVERGSSETVAASPNPYISIPLNNTNTTQAGRLVGVGDLDGDCRYDFVVKRSNGDRDVTQDDPFPEETIKLQAYNGNGEFMWERDVGPNIRPGVWFSPFVVFDFDGNGKAEIAITLCLEKTPARKTGFRRNRLLRARRENELVSERPP